MKTTLNTKLFLSLLLGLSLILCGCDEGAKPQSPTPPISKPQAASPKPGDKAQQGSTEQIMQGVEYAASGKRDPFVSLAKKADIPKGSLIGFEPGELKLIAVLWEKKAAYAVLTTPDAKSFTVRQGTKIGLHGGQIVTITKDSVVIREVVKNYKGVLTPKDTVLKLRRGDEQ